MTSPPPTSAQQAAGSLRGVCHSVLQAVRTTRAARPSAGRAQGRGAAPTATEPGTHTQRETQLTAVKSRRNAAHKSEPRRRGRAGAKTAKRISKSLESCTFTGAPIGGTGEPCFPDQTAAHSGCRNASVRVALKQVNK